MDIFVWKLLLKNLVLPPLGPLILAVIGLVLAIAGRARLRAAGLALSAAGVLLLWVLATPIVADALIRAVERYPALDLAQPIDAGAIVILSGGVRVGAPEYRGPAPNATTLQRLVYGARVARTTGLPVLVSGSRLEAAAMRETLERDLSVTPRWVESRSRDTHENADRSAEILARDGVRRVVLVTSAAHMARAVIEFRAAGLSVVPAPAEPWTRRDRGILAWEPNVNALQRSQRALYEVLGWAVQSTRLRLAPAPAPLATRSAPRAVEPARFAAIRLSIS